MYPKQHPHHSQFPAQPIYSSYNEQRPQNPSYIHPNSQNLVKKVLHKQYEINKDSKIEHQNFMADYGFPDPYIAYKIMAAEDQKKVLDVTSIDNPKKDLVKGRMIIWEYHGGPNQQFYFKHLSGNKYNIINAATGFSLQVPGNKEQTDIVRVNPHNQTPNEVWELICCGRKLYKLKSTYSGKILDINNHFLFDGTPVIQFEDNDGKNQKWRLEPG